ncbi:glycosyltransferase [Roseimicrobium sp. ORNL1]|uniref:glycosyltransferase family 2 protein n=1 Tax=Roseimicrobium sp. ORNL1 TaxID=2711231 RepID=UPI0013E1E968|nr:glycosyltransferase [Roseimicrobium sp. ORNL1]QIF02938.1 glycosyltransferase [Roseimicrobium sp. ORNL1]
MPVPVTERHTPFLSVCIITRGRPALLRQCLERVVRGQLLERARYEVLVSDDDPQGSAREVVEQFDGVRWIQGPGRGVAANRNTVARGSTGEWIVFVDDDELPEANWLEEMHKAACTGRWDVIEGMVESVDYPDSIFWYAPSVMSPGVFCTANLAIRRELLFALGAFDERFAISHEDMDLGRRIRASGIATTFLPLALVKHPARKESLSTAFSRAIQQQYQTFRLLHGSDAPTLCGKMSALALPWWTIVYLYRCMRIEAAAEGVGRWKRYSIDSVIRLLCAPFAAVRFWRNELSQRRGPNPGACEDQQFKQMGGQGRCAS